MDKLIVVQVLEGIDVEYGKRGFEPHGQLRGALRDAITALTQDRAAVLEEAMTKCKELHHSLAGKSSLSSDGSDGAWRCHEAIRALKSTPEKPAEPKLCERHWGSFAAYTTPDTRNPAVADRRGRADAEGDFAPSTEHRRKFGMYGRRAGDPAQWVGLDAQLKEAVAKYAALSPDEKAAHDKAQRESFVRGQCGWDEGTRTTPPTQRAAEVSEDPVWEKPSAWVEERFKSADTGEVNYSLKCYGFTLRAFADHLERYIEQQIDAQFDNRRVKP
jgi:hypothetical protein